MLPFINVLGSLDLEKLREFGFKYSDYYKHYIKEILESDCNLIVGDDKVIYHCNYMTADMNYNAQQLVVEIYDLIQAGLVEKVEE